MFWGRRVLFELLSVRVSADAVPRGPTYDTLTSPSGAVLYKCRQCDYTTNRVSGGACPLLALARHSRTEGLKLALNSFSVRMRFRACMRRQATSPSTGAYTLAKSPSSASFASEWLVGSWMGEVLVQFVGRVSRASVAGGGGFALCSYASSTSGNVTRHARIHEAVAAKLFCSQCR